MPIYTFKCQSCSAEHEEMFSLAERPDEIRCKICSGSAVREVSTSHFKVKGASYANGYAGADNFKWIKPRT